LDRQRNCLGLVASRSAQATSEGWNLEETVRRTGLQPCPWTQGAITGILPKLAEACPNFDWSVPAGAWPKETLAQFLSIAFELIQRAIITRDVVEEQFGGAGQRRRGRTLPAIRT
jgi:hypothetical protein